MELGLKIGPNSLKQRFLWGKTIARTKEPIQGPSEKKYQLSSQGDFQVETNVSQIQMELDFTIGPNSINQRFNESNELNEQNQRFPDPDGSI